MVTTRLEQVQSYPTGKSDLVPNGKWLILNGIHDDCRHMVSKTRGKLEEG